MKSRIRPRVELLEGRSLLSAGALDTSFGGTGQVTIQVAAHGTSYASAVQPDLKIVTVGWVGVSGGEHMAFTRLNADGTLDSTFGTGGELVLPLPSGENEVAKAVTLQPDGKIVAVGAVEQVSTGSFFGWEVVRLNSNGTLDTTFGGGTGSVLTFFPSNVSANNQPNAVAIQSNGQIVVAGGAWNSSATGVGFLGVVRYNTNGTLDTTFANQGEYLNPSISYAGPYSGESGLAIDSSGRIDLPYVSTPTSAWGVVRLTPQGALDPSFGTGGIASRPLPSGIAWVQPLDMGIQSTGQIVISAAADAVGASSPESMLARFNTNGTLDTTFGSGGIYQEPRIWFDISDGGGIFPVRSGAIAIQPDDEIVMVGKGLVNMSAQTQFWVTRVLANGSGYDPSFGTNGIGVANFVAPANAGLAQAFPGSITVGPDGNLVLAGFVQNVGFAVARFLGASAPVTGQLAITQQPPIRVIAGTPFGLTVQVDDSAGNIESTFNGSVTVALANNPGSVPLGGTLSVTASQGVATFSGLSLTTAASGYTLLVSGSGLGGTTTSAITVTASAPSQVVVTQQPPSSITAGSGFGLIASIEDAYGNVVTSAASTVSVALVSNPGGSTLGGTLAATCSNGVATFAGLTLKKAASGYTLSVSASGLTSFTTSALTVSPAAATQLVIIQQPPSNIAVNAPFGLVLAIEDAYGNVVTSANNTVTVAFGNNPNKAKLGGTTSVKAKNGYVTFSGLTINKAGTGDTLLLSSSGLTGATTTPITMT